MQTWIPACARMTILDVFLFVTRHLALVTIFSYTLRQKWLLGYNYKQQVSSMIPLINSKTLIFVVVGGILPALLWLWFWLKEDGKRPEPKQMILYTFIAGGLAVFLAFYLEQYASSNFDTGTLENVNISFSSLWSGIRASLPLLYLFFSWALIEEFVKYLAALLVALRSRHNDEPVDGMIYMITAALGFAAVENSLFLLKTVRLGMSGFDFLINGNLRFLGATLLHVFSSTIVGAAIGLSFNSSGKRKIFNTVVGILLASLLHAFFNFFIIINSGQSIFRVLIALWVFIIVIFLLFEKIKKIKTPYVQR